MNSTIKTTVTIATIYNTYTDDTPSGTHKYLLFGKPTKGEVVKAFDKCFAGNNIKRVTVCEIERHNLTLNLTPAFLVKTVEDFIIELARNELEFESTLIN